LPVEATPEPVKKETPTPTPTKKKKKAEEPATEDAPFDLDLGDTSGIEMDADWVKDLQAAVNKVAD